MRHRIDERAEEVGNRTYDILQTTKFSLVLDETAVSRSEILLLSLVRFLH